jgi:hypothetical protein
MKMKPVQVHCTWYYTGRQVPSKHTYNCTTLEDLKKTVVYFVRSSKSNKDTLTIEITKNRKNERL